MGDAAATIAGFIDPDWVWSQLTGSNPAPFVIWTAGIFLVSFAFGMAARSLLSNRRIRKELGLKPGFERVNTVDRLIDKADALDAAMAERDARVTEMERTTEALRESVREQACAANGLRARLEESEAQAAALRKELSSTLAGIDEEKAVQAAREMEFGEKATLLMLHRHGSVTLRSATPAFEGDDLMDAFETEQDRNFAIVLNDELVELMGRDLVSYETVSGWDRSWSLTPKTRKFVDAHGELFAQAEEYAEGTWKRVCEVRARESVTEGADSREPDNAARP